MRFYYADGNSQYLLQNKGSEITRQSNDLLFKDRMRGANAIRTEARARNAGMAGSKEDSYSYVEGPSFVYAPNGRQV